MAEVGTAKVAFLKRELSKIIELVAAEKERYDKIDYSELDDDKAGDVGDEHELINRIHAHLAAVFEEAFAE
jgi:hypothetical protein